MATNIKYLTWRFDFWTGSLIEEFFFFSFLELIKSMDAWLDTQNSNQVESIEDENE